MVIIFFYITNIHSPVTPNNFLFWQLFIAFLSALSIMAMTNISIMFLHKSFVGLFIVVGFSQCIFLLLSNIYNVIEDMNFIVRFFSFFSIYRYQFQSTLWLIYGSERCRPYEIQALMYMLNIPTNDEFFYECIVKLVLLAIFYHTIALIVFCIKYNPLINRHERAERIERYRNERLLNQEEKHKTILFI